MADPALADGVGFACGSPSVLQAAPLKTRATNAATRPAKIAVSLVMLFVRLRDTLQTHCITSSASFILVTHSRAADRPHL